jgi:hypothetical protein
MRDKTQAVLILLTFLGIVGLYVGLYLAWQKYQGYQATFQQQGALGGILSLLKG